MNHLREWFIKRFLMNHSLLPTFEKQVFPKKGQQFLKKTCIEDRNRKKILKGKIISDDNIQSTYYCRSKKGSNSHKYSYTMITDPDIVIVVLRKCV